MSAVKIEWRKPFWLLGKFPLEVNTKQQQVGISMTNPANATGEKISFRDWIPKLNMKLSNGWCCSQRTDVGVHRGSVHGLDELPKALLIAIHLPVSTDEKLPAHDCSFCGGLRGVCGSFQGSTKGTLLVGLASRRTSVAASIYGRGRWRPLLSRSSIGWLRHARERVSPFQEGEGEERNVMPHSGTVRKNFTFPRENWSYEQCLRCIFVPDVSCDVKLPLALIHFCWWKRSDDIVGGSCTRKTAFIMVLHN